MAHIPHSDIDYVVWALCQYESVSEYLIGLETGDYEHMHFVVQMTPDDYKRFSKRVFVDKYKLRGKATKGLSRQYGKVKAIENLERMQCYTVKDGNVRTNMPEEKLEYLQSQSFQKDDSTSKGFRKELLEYVKTHFDPGDPEEPDEALRRDHRTYLFRREVGIHVMRFMNAKGKILRKTTVWANILYVMQFSDCPNLKTSEEDMYEWMFLRS